MPYPTDDDRDRAWYASRECPHLRRGQRCPYDTGAKEGECWYGRHPEKYKRGLTCPFDGCDGTKCGGYAHRELLCPDLVAGKEACTQQAKCRFGHDASRLYCPDALRGEMCRFELHCHCEPAVQGEELQHYGDCDYLVAPKEILQGSCSYRHDCPDLAKGKPCPRYASARGCPFLHDPERAEGHPCPLVESGRICRLDLDARCGFKHPRGDGRWAAYKAIRCNKSRRDPDSSCDGHCPFGHCPVKYCMHCNHRKEFPWAKLCLECVEELGDHALAKQDRKQRCRVELLADDDVRVRCTSQAAHEGKLRMCRECYERVANLDYQCGDQVTEQEMTLFEKDAKERQKKSRRAKKKKSKRSPKTAARPGNVFDLLNEAEDE